jgi:hypothetical protein
MEWQASYVNYEYLMSKVEGLGAGAGAGLSPHLGADGGGRWAALSTPGSRGGTAAGAPNATWAGANPAVVDPLNGLVRELDREMEKVNQFATSKVQELLNTVLHLSLSAQTLDAKLQRHRDQAQGSRAPSSLKAEYQALMGRVDTASDTVVNLGSFARWNGKILEAIARRCDEVGQAPQHQMMRQGVTRGRHVDANLPLPLPQLMHMDSSTSYVIGPGGGGPLVPRMRTTKGCGPVADKDDVDLPCPFCVGNVAHSLHLAPRWLGRRFCPGYGVD